MKLHIKTILYVAMQIFCFYFIYFESLHCVLISEDGFVQVKVHVVDDIEEFTDLDSLLETLAAILGCESSSIKVDAVQQTKSFIIVLLVKAEFASLLLQKDPEELKGLSTFNVDWIEIEKKLVTIPQSE